MHSSLLPAGLAGVLLLALAPPAAADSYDWSGGIPFTAHAGAGIVAGSDPEAELLETRVKFRPIVDALA